MHNRATELGRELLSGAVLLFIASRLSNKVNSSSVQFRGRGLLGYLILWHIPVLVVELFVCARVLHLWLSSAQQTALSRAIVAAQSLRNASTSGLSQLFRRALAGMHGALSHAAESTWPSRLLSRSAPAAAAPILFNLDTSPLRNALLRAPQATRSVVSRVPCYRMLDVTRAIASAGSEVIGRGAFGQVYRARLGDTDVAIKLLSEDQRSRMGNVPGAQEIADRMVLSEVATLGGMAHRNVVRIVGYAAERNGARALMYEHLHGGSLRELLDDRSGSTVGASIALRLDALIDAARGLTALHSRTDPGNAHGAVALHRDVKPSNIVLATRAGPAKLIDCGLSRVLASDADATHMTLTFHSGGWNAGLRCARDAERCGWCR